MASIGLMEILFLTMFGGSPLGADAISFVAPAAYFQDRGIEVSVESMMKLAATEPKDAKTQVQQLLALRWLAENVDALRKASQFAEHRKTIERIEAGTLAQDAQGFARDYADRVLAHLDGRELPPRKASVLRSDALGWFPADVTLVGAVDFRAAGVGPRLKADVPDLLKKVPPEFRKQVYAKLEKTGNVRIDRIAFAYRFVENGESYHATRVTGKVNPEWVADFVAAELKINVERKKGAKGETILVPAFDGLNLLSAVGAALIGDSELVLGGDLDFDKLNKGKEILEKVLAVRAGEKPNATTGQLKDRLQKAPEKASALLVGDLPAGLGKSFSPTLSVEKVDAFIERIAAGLDVLATATMTNAAEAKSAVQLLSKVRMASVAGLKRQQNQPGLGGLPIQEIIDVLENAQMQAENDQLRLRVVVPAALIQKLPWLLMGVGGAGG